MLSNGNSANSDETQLSYNSLFGSINSETIIVEDPKNSKNLLNKQWYAIERTLYEEEGEHISDPELVKECKLWQETFPHMRVRGTKINLTNLNGNEESVKSIQPIQSHIDLNVLHEKRKLIKDKVVGQLVERLVNRFASYKSENSSKLKTTKNVRPQITGTDHFNPLSTKLLNLPTVGNQQQGTPGLNEGRVMTESYTATTDNESYFERGKCDTNKYSTGIKDLPVEKINERIYEIFDAWEEDPNETKTIKSAAKTSAKADIFLKEPLTRSEKELKPPKGEVIGLKSTQKPVVTKYKSPTIDLLSNQIKPFQPTKKIERKYEGLLNKILERKITDLQEINHCQYQRNTAKQYGRLSKANQITLENMRIKSEFDDACKINNLPKINKLGRNMWLERGIKHAFNTTEDDISYLKQFSMIGYYNKSHRNKNHMGFLQREIDHTIIPGTKKDIQAAYHTPIKNNRTTDDMNLRKPKSLIPCEHVKHNKKSSSCGDLPTKNNKIMQQNRQLRSNLEMVEKSIGSRNDRIKYTKSQSSNKQKQNKRNDHNKSSTTLPPIESGIICTELTGQPKYKISSKTLPKRH